MKSTTVPAINIARATVGESLNNLIIEVDISQYPVLLPLDSFSLLVGLENEVNGGRSLCLVNLGTCVPVLGIGPVLNVAATEVRKDLTELTIEVDISDYPFPTPLYDYTVLVGLQNDINGEGAISDAVCLTTP